MTAKNDDPKALMKLEDCYSDVVLPAIPEAIRMEMLKPTPKQFVKQRPGPGNMQFDYVDVGYFTMILNKHFKGIWSFEIESEERIDKHVTVRGKLTVPLSKDVKITKSQYGSAEIKFFKGTTNPINIGNDYKAAASDCLKKCATEFGICLDIYHPDVYKQTLALKNKKPAGVPAQEVPGSEKVEVVDAETGEVTEDFHTDII